MRKIEEFLGNFAEFAQKVGYTLAHSPLCYPSPFSSPSQSRVLPCSPLFSLPSTPPSHTSLLVSPTLSSHLFIYLSKTFTHLFIYNYVYPKPNDTFQNIRTLLMVRRHRCTVIGQPSYRKLIPITAEVILKTGLSFHTS